jgi:hypothetical protein
MRGHNRGRVMSNNLNAKTDPDELTVYQVRIKGHLGSGWADWFGGVMVSPEDNGETLLTSPMLDQAALHGLLKKVRDLGMPLISVNRVPRDQAEESELRDYEA